LAPCRRRYASFHLMGNRKLPLDGIRPSSAQHSLARRLRVTGYQPPSFLKYLPIGPPERALGNEASLLQPSSPERPSRQGEPRRAAESVGPARAIHFSRRQLIAGAAVLSASFSGRRVKGAEPEMRYDFARPLDGWETVSGTWTIEDVPGAASGGKALVHA